MSDVAPPPSNGAASGGVQDGLGHVGTARDALLSMLVVGLVVTVALGPRIVRGLGPRPSGAECAALVRRYVEHESIARDPELHPSAVDAQIGALADQPPLRRQLESCEHSLAPPQVRCALEAPNVDELERCLQ